MFKSILKNQLLKVISFNSISVLVNFIAGFVSIKFITYFLGAEGMATYGNFKNFSNSAKVFSTLGFNNGITKLIAEHKNDKEKISKIISTAFLSRIFFSLILVVLLIIFSTYINDYVFHGLHFNSVIILLAALIPFYSINHFLISVLNGFKKFEKIIIINLTSTIIGTIISLLLIWKQLLTGALISIATIESIVILVSLFYIKKKDIPFNIKQKYFSRKTIKVLMNFSVMALTTALIKPNSQLYLRNLIISTEGIKKAGQWEALNSISNYYMMVIASGLVMYYLPKLSETKNKSQLKKEFLNYFKVIVPIFLTIVILVYFLRKQIILIILNDTFSSIENLFLWQIIGDTFKVGFLAFGYYIVAKTMTYKYLFFEVFFYGTYILLSQHLLKTYQLEGMVISYAIANILDFLMVFIIFYKLLFTKESIKN